MQEKTGMQEKEERQEKDRGTNYENYRIEDFISVAKRENNKKRNYLLVNRWQGKHVPVSPKRSLRMFRDLAKIVQEYYGEERLLLVGFAETATAIGAAVAAELDCYYMQTTREVIPDVEYLFFSEAHSHATEQKLVRTDLDRVVDEIDRIVFVEDEVTTGNTILNIITLLEKQYPGKCSFAIASLLNGMEPAAVTRFEEANIGLHFLVKSDNNRYALEAERYAGSGTYVTASQLETACNLLIAWQMRVERLTAGDYQNARRLVQSQSYQAACDKLWQQIQVARQRNAGCDAAKIETAEIEGSRDRILVLGTEECMYPGMYVADKLEELGAEVRFHATTRSPIEVSPEADYPLHKRYELRGLYERERVTFVYDLTAYDEVYLITDAVERPETELSEQILLSALQESGNQQITIVRWCEV